ncbi:MAG: PqqD family protein [Kiloniellales bacterium]
MKGGGRYRRNPVVALANVGGQFVLVRDGGEQPYNLDPITSGIWRLLEAPACGAGIFEALADAFPDEPPDQLAEDVARALSDLAAAGLVRQS